MIDFSGNSSTNSPHISLLQEEEKKRKKKHIREKTVYKARKVKNTYIQCGKTGKPLPLQPII